MSLSESLHPVVDRTKLVGAMGVTQVLAWGSTYFLPAVLAAPIARDTNWSITSVVGGLSWGMVVAGATSPSVGHYIDRHGGRGAMALSSLLLAAGLATIGMTESLALYYVAWSLIGFAMAAGLYDAAFSTLGRLFGEGAKTSIKALTLVGGFSSTVGWPAITAMEEWIGWRGTCLSIAAIHLVIGLPIHVLMIPGSAKQPLRPVAVRETNAVGDSSSQSRTLFLLLGLMLTTLALVTSGISVHLLDTLKQLGIATAIALAIGMVMGPAQVTARIAEFAIGRNLHPTWSARVGVLLCTLGLGLLIFGKLWLAFISIALYGAGTGILTIARGTLPLALFGAEGYGSRMGLLARPILVAQACGPILAAWVLKSFGPELLLSMLCCMLLFCLAISSRLPAKIIR